MFCLQILHLKVYLHHNSEKTGVQTNANNISQGYGIWTTYDWLHPVLRSHKHFSCLFKSFVKVKQVLTCQQ